MKSFVVALCVFAVTAATSVDQAAQTLRNDYELKPEGDFRYGYENDNGIAADAVGTIKKDTKGESFLGISGSNTFTSPEGKKYSLTFTADDNGYVPVADYLPTPPAPEPIPEYIQRALEYIQLHPYVEKKL